MRRSGLSAFAGKAVKAISAISPSASTNLAISLPKPRAQSGTFASGPAAP